MKDIYSDGTYLARNSDWHKEDSPYKATLVESALRRSGIVFDSCVDVGCGAGLIAEIFAKNHPTVSVSGFDISPDVRQFWLLRQGVKFYQGDLVQTDAQFDLALCLDVFEHIEDYIGFLRSLRRHAKYFIFNVPLDMNVAKLMTGFQSARMEVGHLHYFNSYTAIETLKLAGYVIVDSFFAAGFKNRPKTLKQVAMACPRWFLTILGPRWASTIAGGYSLVVTAKRPVDTP